MVFTFTCWCSFLLCDINYNFTKFQKFCFECDLFLYSATSAAFGAIVLALASIEFTPIQTWVDGIFIISMSICGGFGVVFLMYAFRNAPSALLAPFSYFGILTSFLIGWLVFNEFPIDTIFPGVILIVLSGLVIIWRENRKTAD